MALLKSRNLLLLLAVIIAGSLAAIALMRYRPVAQVSEVAKSLPAGVDVALQDINYTHTEGGVARWRLVAQQVEHRASEKFTVLNDLTVTFYDVKGAEQGTLKARSGRVDADYSVIEVRDQVEVVSASGYTLLTEHLIYRQKDRNIHTDAPVRLMSAGLQLDGVGLDMDLDTKRLRIPAKVHAVVRPGQAKKGAS